MMVFLLDFNAGRRQRPLLAQRFSDTSKCVQGGGRKDALRFSSLISPSLKIHPFLNRKSHRLFLLGKKTVGFLSQPLLPKGVIHFVNKKVSAHLVASFLCTTSAKSLGDSQFAHPLGFSAWTPADATSPHNTRHWGIFL
jgi:hypothetical protein